ncbi:MAG: WbuC family cupin fold metalloprotein [bacterium]|nr:WbuC family cupin fold metalloprotein [bacterium]
MKIVDTNLLNELAEKAANSPRKRTHYNLHPDLNDKIHRLCLGVEPGSYVRPHRHLTPEKWELLVILKGKLAVLTFDEHGKVLSRTELDSDGDIKSIELGAGDWHTFACLQKGTVIFEIKRGPYSRPIENDFASWAPEEGEPRAIELEKIFADVKVGDELN